MLGKFTPFPNQTVNHHLAPSINESGLVFILMDKTFSSMSPIRQTAIISAVAVLLSFTLTGSLYLLFFGMDFRFWQAMVLAIMVPWGISIPLGLFLSKQRFRLIELTEGLEQAQLKLRQVNKALEQRANFDAMTGLPNRESFLARLDLMRADHLENVLMIVDVDHFKNINDSFGHPIGDQALMLLGKVFRKILRKNDLVGRIGGEEFGIFLPNTSGAEGQIIGEMVRHEIENIIFEPHKNMRHVITVSIGVAHIAAHQDRPTIMGNADAAMFRAKRRGRNRVALFEPGMRAKPGPTHDQNLDLDMALPDAILR
ncbi:MAG: GGDEF domain-containing protein [Parasphingorhabdus sp.]|uniref:GGDEF domain-containing protein n=2 Tax=Parasphingorhabdus sp. TaxID=2709688 RepID=UPI0032671DE3